ncbi:MAG: uroporphyrinogen decarboxylase [Firmicutes bacterium]|jgi:uroporphyrinogen decarboxylase|nr:uroporphyrinogen decarboxylase [Bacillota bacterium]
MNSRERIEAAIAGKPVDKIPFAFWRHFHEIDRDPVALAEATVEFWHRFQLDFVKSMPNGCFCLEEWPCEIDFSQEPAKVVSGAIKTANDWLHLKPVAMSADAFSRELEHIRLIRHQLPSSVPILGTVFSPLTVAQKMCEGQITTYIRSHPAAVHSALEVITDTMRRLVAALLAEGVDGVFCATQMASTTLLTKEEYREFGCPYDIATLDAAQGAWFNVLHIHGKDIMFDLVKDYPVQVLNWHVWETPPSLAEALKVTDKALMGGLDRWVLHGGSQAEIEKQVRDSLQETKGRRFILTPGCVVRLGFNPDNLEFVSKLDLKY